MIELRWLQPAPSDESILIGLLDAAEQTRAARFHHPEDRLAYAAAHALVRTLLSEVAGGAPRDWRFVRTPAGKPRLDETGRWPDLRFSLSHTRGMVACAVSEGIELGVDVEPLVAVPDALILARTYFSAREFDGLRSLAEQARSKAFIHLWTLKEAAIKASGAGLQGQIEHPQFEPRLVATVEGPLIPIGPSDWDFRRLLPAPGFVLSLAFPIRPVPTPVHCRVAEVRMDSLHTAAGSPQASTGADYPTPLGNSLLGVGV